MGHSIELDDFRVPEGSDVKLSSWKTAIEPLYETKKEYRERLDAQLEELRALQELQYASNRYALLIIFQGMDASGKDGAVRHVMSGVNPQGCQVFSFKAPSDEELDHDFLWRAVCRLPERGRIGIFNRSYYEEVLVVRVHPELLERQQLPVPDSDDDDVWAHRFQSIRHLEQHLHRNGTRIIKIFMHESRDVQRDRLLERIDDEEKNWKFNVGDITERKFWNEYQSAYEAALSATSTKRAPWYIVPADDKKNARLIVSKIIVHALQELELSYPKTTTKQRRALQEVKATLLNDT